MGTLAPAGRIRGREAEMLAISAALDHAASGRPAIVLIEGEAGIGKSRLLAEAHAAARARGLQIATGRAEELEQSRPFGIMASVFGCAQSAPDPRRAAIAGLLASQGAGDQGPVTVTSDPGLRFRAVDAFIDLVEDLALAGPLLLGLDDLQWADPSSLLTLGAIGRRLAYLPVALLGCFRPAPRVPELERLVQALEAAGGRQLVLRPLGGQAVAEIVTEMVAAEPGQRLLAELTGAAGNPLFVTELLGAMMQEGTIEVAGGRAEVTATTLPPTLRLTILRRLSFLPEDTLDTLRTASILGTGFSLTDLSAVTARPAIDLSVGLAEAMRAGVLADDGAHLRFRHDLIRDSIYQDLPGSVRGALHREAGQRLAQSGAPVLQVAEHLARGARPGDADAISWLTRAARTAASSSPDVAADLLARAAELMPAVDPDRDRLLADLAASQMSAGRIAEAEATCRSVLSRAHSKSVDGAILLCLGHALLAQGREADGLRELELAREAPALTGPERAGAQAWAAFARLSLGDLGGAAEAAAQARVTAVEAGDHVSASIAMTTLALTAEFRGQPAEALRTIDQGVRLADSSPGRAGHLYPIHIARGHILTTLDRLPEARDSLSIGMRSSQDLGVRWPLPSYQVFLALERFVAGQWDDAVAEFETSFELAEEIGETYSVVLAHSALSLISLHRGDLARAGAAAGAAARELAGRGPRYSTQWAAWPRALLLEAAGDVDQALAAMTKAWDTSVRLGLHIDCPVVAADLVRLALGAGDAGRARDTCAVVTGLAAGSQLLWMTGAALRCRGLIAGDAEVLAAAAGAYRNGARLLDAAQAAEDAGTAFIRQGDGARARPLLQEAVAGYERLDAVRDLARAEAALREIGIRRSRRGAPGRPKFGWASLTATERTVAGLVAEGLSNPQIGARLFVSRRTVQTHVGHVFTKLGLSSRAQLAAELTRQRENG